MRMSCMADREKHMPKLKEGFIYRKIAGEHVVIPIGNNIADFNGVISLNETAAFLWQQLKQELDRPALVTALLDEYEVEQVQAQKDVDDFIALLREHKVIQDE